MVACPEGPASARGAVTGPLPAVAVDSGAIRQPARKRWCLAFPPGRKVANAVWTCLGGLAMVTSRLLLLIAGGYTGGTKTMPLQQRALGIK
jgi:hypothetical protein